MRKIYSAISIKARPFISLLPALLLAPLIFSCASIGTPDGGKYDETPPSFIRSSPKQNSTNVKMTDITIEFDEFIKLEKAGEKVVVSPPQIQQPEIKVNGKKIQIKLLDSLRLNTTYTIDFADGIVDNNESNPLGDFYFNFSTGNNLDTLQVAGTVLNASNLEPIKGILVGLHSNLSDSAFTNLPLERVSRTDSRGQFVIRGLSPGEYHIFALQDLDQDFLFSQKNEQVAFLDTIILPGSETRYRQDTIWTDSLKIDSVITVPYTRYFPDNLILRAFKASTNIHYLVKNQRLEHNKFSLFFSLPADSLPELKGLNFDKKNGFVIEKSPGNDTIHYWIKDSAIYYLDTLKISLTYLATDTNGVLSLTTDTLQLSPRKNRATILKEEARKAEEQLIELGKEIKRLERRGDSTAIAELQKPKIQFLGMNLRIQSTMELYNNPSVEFKEPVLAFPDSALKVQKKVDTLWVDIPFRIDSDRNKTREYTILAEWRPGETYMITVDSASITGLYGLHNNSVSQQFRFRPVEQYSVFTVNIINPKPGYMVELLDRQEKIVRTGKINNGSVDFFFIKPGKYYVRLINDSNGNGKWDTGNYEIFTQPEDVFYINKGFELKQNWEHETELWDVLQIPLNNQKPEEITKQKADAAKKIASRNAEREQKLEN